MSPCNASGLSPTRYGQAAAAKRLLAAVVASALLHTIAATTVSGGSRGRPQTSPEFAALSARLVEIAPPEIPESDPVVSGERAEARPAQPRRATPVRPLPASASAPEATRNSGGSGALAEAPDLTYYGARQLDVFPQLTSRLQLGDLPAGRSLVLVMIDAAGAVTDVSLVESTPGSIGEDTAKRAFMSARFTPAYRNGRAVRSRMLIEVGYIDERASREGGG